MSSNLALVDGEPGWPRSSGSSGGGGGAPPFFPSGFWLRKNDGWVTSTSRWHRVESPVHTSGLTRPSGPAARARVADEKRTQLRVPSTTLRHRLRGPSVVLRVRVQEHRVGELEEEDAALLVVPGAGQAPSDGDRVDVFLDEHARARALDVRAGPVRAVLAQGFWRITRSMSCLSSRYVLCRARAPRLRENITREGVRVNPERRRGGWCRRRGRVARGRRGGGRTGRDPRRGASLLEADDVRVFLLDVREERLLSRSLRSRPRGVGVPSDERDGIGAPGGRGSSPGLASCSRRRSGAARKRCISATGSRAARCGGARAGKARRVKLERAARRETSTTNDERCSQAARGIGRRDPEVFRARLRPGTPRRAIFARRPPSRLRRERRASARRARTPLGPRGRTGTSGSAPTRRMSSHTSRRDDSLVEGRRGAPRAPLRPCDGTRASDGAA